jgi:hypothetical protein
MGAKIRGRKRKRKKSMSLSKIFAAEPKKRKAVRKALERGFTQVYDLSKVAHVRFQ